MPGPIAFLFPGQGSQYAGMGKELAAKFPVAQQTFDEADAALDYKLSAVCFEGPEESLKLTEITQPAILTVSVAACRVLREKGITPSFAAGHSLGEYSAHVAAETLGFTDALRLVQGRGKYMQEAVPVGEGAMAAILGLPLDQVRKVCAEAAGDGVCSPANINSPEQIVISGSKAPVEKAAELAKSRGAKRAVLLPVSAPFHCALMKPAQEKLAADLHRTAFRDPVVPVVSNIAAEVMKSGAAARAALVEQVTGAVEWVASIQALIAAGAETFIEVGPGRVLTGLMRQLDRGKTCLNVEDEASLAKALAHFDPK